MMKSVWKDYKVSQRGNFSVMAGFVIALVMLIVAAAIETSRMSSAKSQLQSITDIAVLAGAIAADAKDANRVEIVLAAIKENSYKIAPMELSAKPDIDFDDNAQILTVQIETKMNPALAQLLGKKELNVAAESSSLYAPDSVAPISIAFALDVSGSMGFTASDGNSSKIETLQDSIGVLFKALEKGSKDKDKLAKALRTGMSAYNTELVNRLDMDYGWDGLEDAVDDLIADGGTNSVPALQNSYDQLLADRVFRKNRGEDISNLIEYVIFMTDGDNNMPEWDDESAAICEAMKNDGIELFSVAFDAPEKGEALLLDCASSNAGQPNANGENDNDNDDETKCMNNGSKGNGNAKGHCTGKDKEKMEEEKSQYYFDASDSKAFTKAFDEIGESIAQVYIRLL